MNSCKIIFLEHSGFLMELKESFLVFDYFQDKNHVLDHELEQSSKPLYFFVSHIHGDHFNPEIARYESRAAKFILHSDCHLPLKEPAKSECLMNPGDALSIDHLSVHMYGSTDAGGSYMIRTEGKIIFHAGDLNWWHWENERKEDNEEARKLYFNELSKIREKQVDFLFFPVDARQGSAREWGIKKMLNHLKVSSLLIPMHSFGIPWVPSYEFKWFYPDLPVWIPKENGDFISL